MTKLCNRCSSELHDGFCSDQTCPFSDHVQSCDNGWYGHPEQQKPHCDCSCRLVTPKFRLAKTTIVVEILHEIDDQVDGLSLSQIDSECTDGAWSCVHEVTEVKNLTEEQAIEECHKQGSDPGFFGIGQEE